jgi:quercetin dioxygenase-like cupin family protein
MIDSKVTFIPATAGEIQHIVGCTHTNKVGPEQSGGAFSAIIIDVPPDCGPPIHYHERDAEWIYVLSGSVSFEHEAGKVVASTGDSVMLPAGRAHGFRNEGTVTARILAVVTPGVWAHQFFTEADATLHGALNGPVLVEIAGRHGIQFGVPSRAAAAA